MAEAELAPPDNEALHRLCDEYAVAYQLPHEGVAWLKPLRTRESILDRGTEGHGNHG